MTSNAHPARYGYVILASTLLFGSTFPATKAVLQEMTPLWAVSLRFLVAALSIYPFLLLNRIFLKRPIIPPAMPWRVIAAVGLLQTAGSTGFLNLGLRTTSAPKASILMACTPLIVALLSAIVFKEKIRLLALLGLLISFVGVVLCIGPAAVAAGTFGLGDALVLCGALCWSVATLLVKRANLRIDIFLLSFWQMAIGALVLAALAAAAGEKFAAPVSAPIWLAFLWLAVPATTGAMALWFLALRLGGAVQTCGYLFLSPLFASIISFFAFGYVLSPIELAGGVLIGLGIYLGAKGAPKPAALAAAA
ncbi:MULTISPECIES: DMT family transporter [unclassified Janthinobacterium]|uniref:DMT family transporter n=1 Tax=unclassified Janthinobacterium TaxID=2610881 RepID=UPI00034CB399|nr:MULTISPECIES: DMT family transporter [unclassified Janthinobacterium]MEC5161734.1 drug/metabolite transporter (DMT)-like permease [Janthinobacterium sp. CG_S6]